MAEDARIRKTKEKLSAALVELLKDCSFEEITPAKICEKAGINRSTFYRNYKNITQLKNEMEQKILDSVEWGSQSFDRNLSRKVILQQLKYLKEKAATFDALSSAGFKESIFEKVASKLVAGAEAQYGSYPYAVSEEEYQMHCTYTISAMVAVFYHWYQDGMEMPPERVADFLTDKLERCFKELYGE